MVVEKGSNEAAPLPPPHLLPQLLLLLQVNKHLQHAILQRAHVACAQVFIREVRGLLQAPV